MAPIDLQMDATHDAFQKTGTQRMTPKDLRSDATHDA